MKKISLLTSIIATIFCSILLISNILAWFTGIYREDFDIDGRVNGGYFAGGTGEATNPYIITNKKHMRNLALLQNNGKFNTGNDIYYFKIGDDVTSLDMSGIWIPPIGTTLNPFKGNFDGNGKIISGLRVTTNEKLSGSKVTSSAFSDVGFFGSVEGEDASISKFTLDDIYVDHNINTTYSGIIAGEAPKDSIQYVGVHTARLGYQENKTADSNFALIGNTEAHTMTVENPGGDTPGGDDPDGGDTGHFIPDTIYNGSNGTTNPKYGTIYPENATVSGKSAFVFTTNMWLISNNDATKNLGLGCFSFVSGTETTDIRYKPITSFYYYDTPTNGVYNTNGNISDGKLIDLTNSYTNDATSKEIREKVQDIGGGQLSKLNYILNFKNSPNYIPDGGSKTAAVSVVCEDNSYLNQTAEYYSIYNNSIKFNIRTNKAKVFVIASYSGSDRILGLYNISAKNSENKNIALNSFKTDYTKFYYSSNVSSELSETEIKKANPLQSIKIGDANAVACEFDLTGADYGPGEYMINSTSGAVYIHYMAVIGVDGDTGGGTEDPTSTVSYISTVDFVDSGVIITDTYEDYSYVLFIVALPATNSDTVIYFKRDDDDDGTNKVYYGTNGNGTVTNVNTTHQGVSFTDFTDYPQVNTNA